MHVHTWQHNKYLNNPVAWLRGPRFLLAWHIHVSCNPPCAMHGIVTCGIITHETGHARDSHEWNMCRHKYALTFVIYQRLTYINMSNSVHNCESHSRMNYQGIGLIEKDFTNGTYYCCVSCCSVSQLYKYKQSGNKARSM